MSGKGKEVVYRGTEDTGEFSERREHDQVETPNIAKKMHDYGGKKRSKESIEAHKGSNRYITNFGNYQKKHGKIEEVVKYVKDTNYSGGRNNKRRPEFEERGKKELGGKEWVTDPYGVFYVGEDKEIVSVSRL